MTWSPASGSAYPKEGPKVLSSPTAPVAWLAAHTHWELEEEASIQGMTLRLLTMPVSTNQLYRVFRNRSILSVRGRSNKELISWEARQQYWGEPLEGPLAVKIDLYWGDKRKHDVDHPRRSWMPDENSLGRRRADRGPAYEKVLLESRAEGGGHHCRCWWYRLTAS
jgi:hypothetical protein